MTIDAAALLRLLAWLSPAFPTGGFAYSHGVEWAVETGAVRDAETLHDWLRDLLAHGSGRNDAILLRHAHRGLDVDDLARATQPTRERLMETVNQGTAFLRAAGAWGGVPWSDLTYPVAVGRVAGRHGVDEHATALAYTQALVANVISAAVRLVPLGQTSGLAVLAALEPDIVATVSGSAAATLDDLGGSCLRADLFSALHETQYTRLFRS